MKPEIEHLALDTLIPYARNSRTHSDEQVAQIAASIREFGFTNPVLVDDEGGIIAGHGRVLAARKLSLPEVPCIRLAHLSEAQKRAYVIADNKLALNAGWDNELLALELDELKLEGFELELTGFTLEEIDALTPEVIEPGLTDEDAVPEVQAEPVSKLGDVWIMGRHRLVCGDATNVDDWAKLRVGDGFVLFTSPPYNAGDASGLRDKYRPGVPKTNKFYDAYSDDLSGDEYVTLLSDTVTSAFTFVDTVAINVQPLAGSKRALLRWMNQWASHLVDIITWDKGRAAPHIQPGIMASRYEWIVILSRIENASRVVPHSSWQGKYSNVYQAPPQSNNEYASVHGATFPVHLPEFVIGDMMNRSRGVVDCFMGTGTTIIAAEKLGRDGCGIELSPTYCDVIVRRWQEFTGKAATLEADGRTFAEVTAEHEKEPAAA
jgi:DNA modification methylase